MLSDTPTLPDVVRIVMILSNLLCYLGWVALLGRGIETYTYDN